MVVSLSAAAGGSMGAGEVGVVALSGILIVFAVLAIIYLALLAMQAVFTKGEKTALCEVAAPFAGKVEYFVANPGRVEADEVVLVLSDASGRKNEILAPQGGRFKPAAHKGDAIEQGGVLFTIG